ncbi:DUF58 domain-containing protein [Synechocystis sp. LKSZ1]|uniref:DUF58 domain-containing protein n=1 Tax=Synechocystis sp. LKSZ1 TaxID=3144951 RepID=UPI00336BBF4B
MKLPVSPTDWLERRWVTPAYAGWLLLFLTLCFFGAATNTMAGWLYVLSGLIIALLFLGAWFPPQVLKRLAVERLPIAPVSAGEDLTITVLIRNHSGQAKTLLQAWDLLPPALGRPQGQAIEAIPPQSIHRWSYYQPTSQRGIYRWQGLELRTGAPLGLFWCRRRRPLSGKAVVYPQVLPLRQCPLIDVIGQEENPQWQSQRRYQAASEGVTKTLRPYRYGDSTRLIHWRSSARLDIFQVRELEVVTGGQDIVITLDSGADWAADRFEQAVIAAASLYFYAQRAQFNVKLWTAGTGLVAGNQAVLETLAAVQFSEPAQTPLPQRIPLLWLTGNTDSLGQLSGYSRWLWFRPSSQAQLPPGLSHRGLIVDPDENLTQQLQQPLPRPL